VGTAVSRFCQEFSRISAHPHAVRTIEKKPPLSTPGDVHEQAAGAIAKHELVHTTQKGNDVIYRKIDFTEPKPILADPIPLALGGTILGNTLPGLNGTLLRRTAIKKDYKEAVFQVLQPQTFTFAATQKGKTCKVDPDKFNINVFAEVRAITDPKKDKWSGTYSSSVLSNPPSACSKKSKENIEIEMEGKPDSAALYKKVLAHEHEHVTDLRNLSTKELKPYHDFLIGVTGTGNTEEDCVNDIFKQVGKRDALAANEFVDKWLDAVQVYDKKGGKHHSQFVTKVDPECTKLEITEKI
jgi:hypothetical protein